MAQYSPNEPDHYAVLRLSPDADEEMIRLAYRKLAREFHPDVAGEGSAETMKQINAAYRVLSDPAKRREYDAQRGMIAPPSRPRPGPMPSHGSATMPKGGGGGFARTSGPFKLYRLIENPQSSVSAITFARGDEVVGIGYSDGRVELWHLAAQQRYAALGFLRPGDMHRPGVLQDLRLSPSGSLAMAWGLNLGTRVWDANAGRVIWSAAVNGPSGTMDAILIDTPPLARLALPAAPIALAEDDPFRWAEAGRLGSEIMTRPLDQVGAISPAWAVPMRADEPSPSHAAGRGWRVHLRSLSWDGELLLTFSSGPVGNLSNASILHLWNLRTPSRHPQRIGHVIIPMRALWYPIAVASSATIVALQFEERGLRLYDLTSGRHIEIPTGPLAQDARMALSADGALLAIATPEARRVDLWATASGQRVQSWQYDAAVSALSFAATGGMPTLAMGHNNGSCEIWAAG